MKHTPLMLSLIAAALVVGIAAYNQAKGGESAYAKSAQFMKDQSRLLPEGSGRE